MRWICALLVVAVIVRGEDHDNVDIDALLADKNQFNEFVTCFLDTAPCSDISASFKKDIPVAVLEACDKCTPAQKHIVSAFIASFQKEPQHFEAFKAKYDRENKYLDKLKAAVTGF